MLDLLATAGGEAAARAVALFSFESLVALLTLTALEIVLGIDNIVFLSILAGKVDPRRQDRVRRVGLLLAMGMRILLLLCIAWVMRLTAVLFTVAGLDIAAKDLVLLGGGLFLIAKGTYEIHDLASGGAHARTTGGRAAASVPAALAQVALMDLIFSLDSVVTAVGMARRIEVMIAAVVVAVLVMMAFAGPVARFVESHLPIKNLALAFLVMIGVLLVADGLHQHLPRGYVYFAMAFSLAVELLNMRAARRQPQAQEPE